MRVYDLNVNLGHRRLRCQVGRSTRNIVLKRQPVAIPERSVPRGAACHGRARLSILLTLPTQIGNQATNSHIALAPTTT